MHKVNEKGGWDLRPQGPLLMWTECPYSVGWTASKPGTVDFIFGELSLPLNGSSVFCSETGLWSVLRSTAPPSGIASFITEPSKRLSDKTE